MGGFFEKLGIPGSMKLNFLLVCRFFSERFGWPFGDFCGPLGFLQPPKALIME